MVEKGTVEDQGIGARRTLTYTDGNTRSSSVWKRSTMRPTG
jgi:hypothetical protein